MKTEKISIKWKIFSYMLVFTVILLIILWLFQIAYLDAFYKKIRTSEAQKATSQIVELLKNNARDEEISEAIDQVAAANGMAVLVTDAEGELLYNAEYIINARMNGIPQTDFEKYYQTALENGGSAEIEFEGNENKTFMNKDIAPPEPLEGAENRDNMGVKSFMQNRGQEFAESVILVKIVDVADLQYVVMTNMVLTPVDATVNTLKIQLIWISVVMVLLSLGIALLLSKKVSKSMIKVVDSADELARGNYQVEFEGTDYREIAELSDTLNYMTKELEKTENLRRELIANVSHDLRTPLTMIIAYSEVMRDLPGENSPENIQVVIDESKRLANLVNDMLDISKLQAGVLEKNSVIFNLTDSIQSVFERYNKLKEQDGYNINFCYDREIYVCADEFKIYQVIYNLVNNAINYTGEDKTVTVKQIISGELVRIEVTDSGEGIAPADVPYVWERYYKVDKTHKRAVAGTGLGLSIVKNILELHGAAYGVDSQLGNGSTFWFCLKIEQ